LACNGSDPTGQTIVCTATPAIPGTETCNGLDDDCDGTVDSAGTGACSRPGVFGCDVVLNELACNAVPGPEVPEICNDIDDDCDGEVDEEFLALGTECIVGVGACSRAGTFICSPVNGTRICDVQPGGPSAEVCDALDNDCDGNVDETFGVGNACNAPGICGSGVLECNPVGQTRCSTGPGGSGSLAIAELCNGLDDNCDGLVDDTFVYSLGNSCYGCMMAGVYECASDGVGITCSTSAGGSAAPEEICGDSYDNDCDYATDEVVCTTP
jgi:hypothetical protein